MNKSVEISIIIVHYKNEPDLFECLESLYKFKTKKTFEVIIVDNSRNKTLKSRLNKYKNLKYISSPKNLGYGSGMNLGAKKALGKYLFILNPDVIFTKDIVTGLLQKISNVKDMGIIAPLLYSTQGEILEQGAKEITIKRVVFKFSFLDRIWPNNSVSKNYWVNTWGKEIKKVDNVPGTAFIIRKDLFNKINGFDQNFFLYFEEFDLCIRVRELGYKIYIDPNYKLIHKWGTTTKLLANKDEIFEHSRFYYFKKHFGLFNAYLLNSFLKLTPKNILFIVILIVALIIRLYNISVSVPLLIGDQGWFYLSARNLLLNFNFPLVGITSSHTWLHQGPLWTYVLAIIFWITNYNSFAPAIFTVILDIFTLIFLYLIVGKMFSKNTAIFASILYAFSPYVILGSRMPYHTSFIPILTLLLIYSLYKWISAKLSYFFPISIFLVSLLYNFELSTSILFILLLIFLVYGFVKKKEWFKILQNKKIFAFSYLAFAVPMFPIIIYDLNHGFSQTVVFAGWVLYKGLSFPISLFTKNSNSSGEYLVLVNYIIKFSQNLIFTKSSIISLFLITASLIYLIYINIKNYSQHKIDSKYSILLFLIVFLFGSIIIGKTPSDAYLYSVIIPFIILVSIFLNKFFKDKYSFIIIFTMLLIFSISNVTWVLNSGYYNVPSSNRNGMFNRLDAVKYMVKNANGNTFKIVGKGSGSQFESFTASYEYLAWHLGGKVEKQAKLVYVLYETHNGIKINVGD